LVDDFGDTGVILPSKAVKLLVGLLKDYSGSVIVTYAPNVANGKFKFECPEFTLVSKAIQGTFPDYVRVIPDDTDIDHKKFKFTADTYIQLNKKLVKHPEYKFAKAVKFDGNVAEYKDMKFAVADTYPIEIGFSIQYLAGLGISGEASVEDCSSPMKIVDGRKTVVIMPMRV
jgi:DNA polymerase-3 subunit beta